MTFRPVVALVSLLAGLIPGIFAVWLHTKDMRWIFALGAALPVGVIWLLAERRALIMWYAFVLGTQAYISVRIFHGRAGSEGIEFPLMFVLGAAAAIAELADRDNKTISDGRIHWGGPLALPIFLILFTGANSLIFTSERFVALTGLARIFQFYALYLVGLNFVRTPERLNLTIRLLAIVLLMQSAIFGLQAATGVTFSLTGDVYDDRGVRAGGTVGANSAIYATFVAPLVFLLAARFLSPLVENRERLILIVPLAAGLLSTLFTLRRGAWGGMVLGFVWLAYVGSRRKSVFTWVPKACAAAVLVGALAAPVIITIVDHYRPDNPMDEAFDERVNLMRIALGVAADHPIAGVGIASYSHVFKEMVPVELNQGWLSTVHNYYLLVAAETGIPGLIAFILFLFGAGSLGFRVSRSNNPDVALAGLGIGGAVVCHAFSVAWEPLRDFAPNAMLWFLIGMVGSVAAGGFASADEAGLSTGEEARL